MDEAIQIPYQRLSQEALRNLIENFVSRDGPDPGHVATGIEKKIEQVMTRLKSGRAVILYDPSTESCNIFSMDDPQIGSWKVTEHI